MKAYRHGETDYMMKRACKCPFPDWHDRQWYLQGYMAAQERGVQIL
jgi:hypothetical protein